MFIRCKAKAGREYQKMNKENNLRNYSLAQQEYQTKSEEELQAQEVDRKARKDIYTNLFRLADRGKSGSNEMLFWQFILQFYAYCLEKKEITPSLMPRIPKL